MSALKAFLIDLRSKTLAYVNYQDIAKQIGKDEKILGALLAYHEDVANKKIVECDIAEIDITKPKNILALELGTDRLLPVVHVVRNREEQRFQEQFNHYGRQTKIISDFLYKPVHTPTLSSLDVAVKKFFKMDDVLAERIKQGFQSGDDVGKRKEYARFFMNEFVQNIRKFDFKREGLSAAEGELLINIFLQAEERYKKYALGNKEKNHVVEKSMEAPSVKVAPVIDPQQRLRDLRKNLQAEWEAYPARYSDFQEKFSVAKYERRELLNVEYELAPDIMQEAVEALCASAEEIERILGAHEVLRHEIEKFGVEAKVKQTHADLSGFGRYEILTLKQKYLRDVWAGLEIPVLPKPEKSEVNFDDLPDDLELMDIVPSLKKSRIQDSKISAAWNSYSRGNVLLRGTLDHFYGDVNSVEGLSRKAQVAIGILQTEEATLRSQLEKIEEQQNTLG